MTCLCTGLPEAPSRERAQALARDIIEYLDSIDYNKYYDDMRRPGTRGGTSEKQFSDFSVRAVDAAQVRAPAAGMRLPCAHACALVHAWGSCPVPCHACALCFAVDWKWLWLQGMQGES